jgi:two-component system sensor histidine kinase DesK
LVWLVAGAHELVATREAVAQRAAEREHERLELSMRASLEHSLSRLAVEARRARDAMLEPGVAAALVVLDRVLALAQQASDQLRRSVARARSVAPEPDPGARRLDAAGNAGSPIGRGLIVPGARRSFVVTQVFVLGVVPLAALGTFGAPAPGVVVLPAWFALTVVQLSSLRKVASGLRPPWAFARLAFALSLTITMMVVIGPGWRDPGWFAGVAVAVAFTGRRRIVLLGLVVAAAGVYGAWRAADAFPLTDLEIIWDFSYLVTQTALGVVALYGSARLIGLLGELDLAREQWVRYAVDAEHRRAWGDLHDMLGQSLVAITLKADLARRLLTREPARSREELDELIELAAGQAQELAVIARGEVGVEFETELTKATWLLRAAGIEVSTVGDVEVSELDTGTSALLGMTVREGTTNILRHAHARHVRICLSDRSGRLALEIRNDGASGDAGAGTGLRSLAERAAARDGVATGSLLPGEEFALTVSLPEGDRV